MDNLMLSVQLASCTLSIKVTGDSFPTQGHFPIMSNVAYQDKPQTENSASSFV